MFIFRKHFEIDTECCFKSVRQQLQVSAASVKTVFPPAVHLDGYDRYGGQSTFHEMPPLHQLCVSGPLCDRQGKSFTKPFNLTCRLCFSLLTCTCCLTWKVQEFQKKLCLPPEVPKFLPLTVSGRNFSFEQLPLIFR